MQLTQNLKFSISTAIKRDYDVKSNQDKSFTQTRHATILEISASVHSRILSGDVDGVLSAGQWIRIGKKLGVDLTGQGWKLAPITTYNIMYPQIQHCKEKSVGRVFSDLIGIGKTTTALSFARNNVNVAYVNCKKYRSTQLLIRAIARDFGFEYKGRFIEVRENLVNNIMTLHRPMIILDDAGYLEDKALLETIGMWDDLEQMCGWYFIGEPAFKKRLEKMILNSKLGFEAWFNRLSERILSVTEDLEEGEIAMMKRTQAADVLKLNYPNLNKQQATEILNDCKCNLRTLRDDINKLKTA